MNNTEHDGQSLPTNDFREFAREDIDQSIVDRFEQQVVAHSDRLALRTRDRALTYQELNARANTIARALLGQRGKSAEPVALLIRQGASLVASILGVLKAGKLYLPMDPGHPPARNAGILQEAGASLVLTDDRSYPIASGIQPDRHLVINVDTVDGDAYSTNVGLPLTADTNAYIFYTSGSTGRPKGVYDSHRNVLHNIMRYTNSLHISAVDRLTLLQSASFSGSVSSLFAALLNGASVFPYDVHTEGLGGNIANWLIREEITIYHSVPAIFRTFLQGDRRFPSVRIIRLEGDAASRVDVELFKKHFAPRCLLVNGLGATETGITRQFFMNKNTTLAGGGIVPIGYPTSDMKAMVVDDTLHEVAHGTIGEIVVKSRYLATGYWRNPELTNASFIPDPGGSDDRIYRTGDMGRMRDDGCLEYCGRRDLQLKIRGHRVEPAEVEEALLRIRSIREAVATTVADESGEPRLVAYLVSAVAPHPEMSSIREALAMTVPDYLIPTRFILLDSLPLNENGKVDRQSLPAPADVPTIRTADFVSPRTDLERQVAAIWEKTLNMRPIGVKDNFFDLGGDSLMAAAMFAAVEELGKGRFPLSTLIEAPTVEELARRVREGAGRFTVSLVPIQPAGTRPPFFCVHSHHGDVLGYALLSRELGNDQPFYGLQSIGLSGEREPLMKIEEMAALYVREIRGVQPQGPYHIGGFCYGGVVALEIALQLNAMGEKTPLVMLIHNTPADFPGLVPRDALRRFWRRSIRERVEQHSKEVLKRGVFQGGAYLAQGIGRQATNVMWRIVLSAYHMLGLSLPRALRKVDRTNTQAIATYTPGRYPGRITLILAEESKGWYSADPRVDWGGLAAGGYSVFYVPGAGGALFREPHVKTLAATFREALHGSMHHPSMGQKTAERQKARPDL